MLPYDEVCDLPNLRISPLDVVPQRDRRPRLIVDYTFSNVNQEIVPLAPREAMQFGRTLQRIMHTIVHADPRYGPVHMSKIDIADGFYRVWVQLTDIPTLGVALPVAPGSTPLVAFPLALPMGWVESPPFFTTSTETVCDLSNAKLADPTFRGNPHRLEQIAQSNPTASTDSRLPPKRRPPLASPCGPSKPVAGVDIYVDDFPLLSQTKHQQQRVLRSALHSIDEVFRPLTSGDPPDRKEPSSVKKMLEGDAAWSTQKRLLGSDFDTELMTLNLPPHRIERLREVVSWIQAPKKRLPTTKWHQLLGELCSMSPALPGTRGLFSTLQEALSRGDKRRIRLNSHVHATAADFLLLIDSLSVRPTRLQELVPQGPSAVGACDACRHGMGGVWLSPDHNTIAPVVWRAPFPVSVSSTLVTSDNPTGQVSISDCELAGIIAHKDVATTCLDVRERTLWIASDNRAAVAWSTKGSSTSITARAYLLQYNALHQRQHRYIARHHYIPGPVNAMADDASWRWDLTDTELLTHFNTHYPQAVSWNLKRRHDGCLTSATPTPPRLGVCGNTSAPPSTFTPRLSAEHRTPCLDSSFLLSNTAPARSLPAVTLSALGQWRTPYERLARRMPGWGPLTLA